ncbi:crAss001_48 related protein, partial [Klebsiella pneumoniae]
HEQTELQDKSTKLAEFIKSSPIFAGLDGNQQGLLKAQLGAMQAYGEILILRIAAF